MDYQEILCRPDKKKACRILQAFPIGIYYDHSGLRFFCTVLSPQHDDADDDGWQKKLWPVVFSFFSLISDNDH